MPDGTDHPAIRRVVEAAARHGISLDVRVFGESTHTAADAAAAIGCDLGQIVKSLVFVVPDGDRSEPILCLVSGSNRVELPQLAEATARPGVRRATAREANLLTGFTIGGIPPFGHPTEVRVVMDPDLDRYPIVWAAAGTPTAVFGLAPDVLRTLARAEVLPIAVAAPAPA